jgi:TolA-binding protein
VKKQLIMALSALFIFSFSYASFHANMSEEEAYSDANSSFNKQDLDGAGKSYAEFLDKFPQSKYRPQVLLKQAALAASIEDADKIYHTVMADYAGTGSEAEASYNLGRMYYAAGDYAVSKPYFAAVTEKFQDTMWVEESYYYLLMCMYQSGDNDAFDRTLDAYGKKDYSAFRNRVKAVAADSLYTRGKFAEAAAAYRDLIDRTGGRDKNIYMPGIYFKLQDSLTRSGDTKGSDAIFSDLKNKFPKSIEATGSTETAAVITPAKKLPEGETYSVQVGAYTNRKFCDYWEKKLKDKNFDTSVKKDGRFFKLSVGKFNTKQEAQKLNDELFAKVKVKGYITKQ